MSGLVQGILGLPGWLVLLVAGSIVLTEDALFIGFLVPGETVALLAGAAAALHRVPLAGVLLVVVLAAIAGDSVGYGIGHVVGPRLLNLRVLQRRQARIDETRAWVARRGGVAVFLGRWVAFLRSVVPAAAGAARMPYRRFLAWNVAGGIAWGTAVVLLGYAAGGSYARAAKSLGRDAAVLALAVVLLAFVVWRVGRRRRAGDPSSDGKPETAGRAAEGEGWVHASSRTASPGHSPDGDATLSP
jgi:membrane-associated protein